MRGKVGHLQAIYPELKRKGGPTADLTLAVNEASEDSDRFCILDSGSSRHLVNDAPWLDQVEDCGGECLQPNGEPLSITKKGTLTLHVTTCGSAQTVKLTDAHYSKDAVHNLISYCELRPNLDTRALR